MAPLLASALMYDNKRCEPSRDVVLFL